MVRFDEWFVPYNRAEPPEPKTKKDKHPVLTMIVFDVIDSVKTSIIIVFFLFTFVFRAEGVEGTSMVPTLNDGDWLAVTAVNIKPVARGDIVVVTQPWERNVPIIKRVIGVEGDIIYIDYVAGDVYVNNKKLIENYISEKTHFVPDVWFFFWGHNIHDSLDSRSSEIGFINENYVLGKTVLRFHPLSQWRIEEKEAKNV